ncbi:MAG: hypothetical protein HZB25_06320 [Candidatus Eisenbacteria bacterium]|nr:hypothetical protein [Candidatus Eisenbacteria bacterium]
MRRGICGLTVPAAAVGLPGLARACAVCGAGAGPGQAAFFWTTVLLSLLPLAMLAAGLLYLRRAVRRHLPDEFADPDEARFTPPAPAP